MKVVFQILVTKSQYLILALVYRFFAIGELDNNGKQLSFSPSKAKAGRSTLLAIGAEGFLGELEALSRTTDLRILTIERMWLSRITKIFYSHEMLNHPLCTVRCHYAPKDEIDNFTYQSRVACQRFLGNFLRRLYQLVPIDAVLLYNVRYLPDLDWAKMSKELGLGYFVVFREAVIVPTKESIGRIEHRHRLFGTFRGDHIFVGNEAARQSFVNPGFALADQVTTSGLIRMDRLLEKVKLKTPSPSKKTLTVFWWSIFLFSGHPKFRELTFESIKVFIDLARECEDIDIVIKPKRGESTTNSEKGHRQLVLEDLFDELDPHWRIRRNLIIEPNSRVEDLIFSSTVVSGIQSTALLEAALARKPVVVPFFSEFEDTLSSTDYQFRMFHELFDIAKTKNQFKEMIKSRMANPTIDSSIQQRREECFSRCVTDISGNSTERVASQLIQQLRNKKSMTTEPNPSEVV